MTRTGTAIAFAAGIIATTMVARAEQPKAKAAGKKALVSCASIVETYKTNRSVDETADALFVDQSVVAACLKAAGITPNEQNR